MKLTHLIVIVSFGLALSGCTSTAKSNNATLSIKKSPPVINPISVTLYTGKQKPHKPYVVLGHETVSKYNMVGIKRQEANLKDSIRHLAATRGGDAVIEITNHPDSISYTVISYKTPSTDTDKA